jgi:signal transduction histidine kinase
MDDDHSVRFEVEDNGPGISPEIRSHIFEPFFTTKTVGAGTGLGLSVSYFIITRHHGGQIYFEPSRRGGCTFVIILPKHIKR